MIKYLRNRFISGLLILIPVVTTLKILIWGFNEVDSILGNLLYRYFKLKIPGVGIFKIPGLGLVTLLILITLTGILAGNYLGRRLIESWEQLLGRIPILRSIYNTIKQLIEGFSNNEKNVFHKVVLVEYPRAGLYSPGFLTGESYSEMMTKTGQKLLNVFIPTVPNPATGFLILVPSEQVIVLDMSIEDGFKLVLSAGFVKPN